MAVAAPAASRLSTVTSLRQVDMVHKPQRTDSPVQEDRLLKAMPVLLVIPERTGRPIIAVTYLPLLAARAVRLQMAVQGWQESFLRAGATQVIRQAAEEAELRV